MKFWFRSRLTQSPRSARLFLVLAALAGGLSATDRQRLVIDPGSSEVQFRLGGNIHVVHGSFEVTEGHVLFIPGEYDLSGRIVVSARSGDTANGKVEHRMHKEILESHVFSPDQAQAQTFDDSGYAQLGSATRSSSEARASSD